jgi:hypothetical protein
MATYFKGGHEGDDGETATLPASSAPTTMDYFYMGWFCKMEVVSKFSEASFCGIVADEEELINVCDIHKAVAEVGWTGEKYAFSNSKTMLALIRAKGYSMVYQYYRCPVLDALGRYLLRVTDDEAVDRKMRKMIEKGGIADSYKREILKEAIEAGIPPEQPPGPRTRELVQRLYNISELSQVQVEKYFDSLNRVMELEPPLDFPALWKETYENYTSLGYDRTFRDEGALIRAHEYCKEFEKSFNYLPFF